MFGVSGAMFVLGIHYWCPDPDPVRRESVVVPDPPRLVGEPRAPRLRCSLSLKRFFFSVVQFGHTLIGQGMDSPAPVRRKIHGVPMEHATLGRIAFDAISAELVTRVSNHRITLLSDG